MTGDKIHALKTGSSYFLGVLFKFFDEHPCPTYMHMAVTLSPWD